MASANEKGDEHAARPPMALPMKTISTVRRERRKVVLIRFIVIASKYGHAEFRQSKRSAPIESRSFTFMFKSQNVSQRFRITTTSFYADRHAHNLIVVMAVFVILLPVFAGMFLMFRIKRGMRPVCMIFR